MLEPNAFDPARIAPETVEWNRSVEERLAVLPTLSEVGAPAARQAREEGRSWMGPLQLSPRAETITIPGPAGEIPARVFRHPRPRGVMLHIHGGGWVLGASHHQDPRLEGMCEEAGVTVVSLDYRLAPEHPYPAGPDDCEAAALWLVANADRQFGSERLVIGGESAGAHLAVVTLLRLRDRHGLTPFLGANLVYGVYDLRLTPSARRWGDRRLVLWTEEMRWFVDCFVPPERREDPDVSPILADLAGLGAARFTVGTQDLLLDDTLFMHARWVAAGNPAQLAVYPGGSHGFDAFPIGIGREALRGMRRFVGALVG